MIQHRLHGLRGKAFVREYKRILAEESDSILAVFEQELNTYGKLTAKGLGRIAMATRLPLTVLDDCLPSITNNRYPIGTWERLRDIGFTAKGIGVEWREFMTGIAPPKS